MRYFPLATYRESDDGRQTARVHVDQAKPNTKSLCRLQITWTLEVLALQLIVPTRLEPRSPTPFKCFSQNSFSWRLLFYEESVCSLHYWGEVSVIFGHLFRRPKGRGIEGSANDDTRYAVTREID